MMEALLESFAQNIADNSWLAPVMALFAGVVASFMPCSLSSIPLIIAYVGSSKDNGANHAFGYSVAFAAGNALTFVIMALVAVYAGRMLGIYSRAWLLFLAILMFAMALQIWGVVNFIPSLPLFSKMPQNVGKGTIGAFIAGIFSGVFSSPCSTPVLIALLSVISVRENLLRGVVLMLCYALGYSVLALIAGTSVGFVQKLNASQSYQTASKAAAAIAGALIMCVGGYMLYLARMW